MHSIPSEVEPRPALVPVPPRRNFRPISFTRQATPAIPTPLLPTAPMMPATCVPWPRSSAGLPEPVIALMPWTSSTYPLPSSSRPLPGISPGLTQRLAARSGWSVRIPESITATITSAASVRRSQARVEPRSAPAMPLLAPVFRWGHWRPVKSGSSGTTVAWRRWSRCTYS